MEFCSLIIHWEGHRRQMGYWRLCILLTYDIKKAEHLHTKDDNTSKTTKRDEHKVSVTASQWHNWPKLLSHFQILYWIWIWIFVCPPWLSGRHLKRKKNARKIWICMVVLFIYYLKVIQSWKKSHKSLKKPNLVELQSMICHSFLLLLLPNISSMSIVKLWAVDRSTIQF